MENKATVRIEGVSKRFGGVKALDDVSFEIPRRSVFGLLGPNGAGKTTLFSIIANFLRADAGSVSVLGIDTREISKLRGRMSILPQDAQFQKNMPILEQLTFFRRLEGASREDARREVKEVLDRVGLTEYYRRGIGALSHGMTQRLGVAQAFLGSPEVILLDEPTSGLDPKNARQIRDLIRELQSRATVVVSSHNLLEIQEICDHVAILDHGKVVACGSVREITRSSGFLEVEFSREPSEEELLRLQTLDGVKSVERRKTMGYRFQFASPESDPDELLSKILAAFLEMSLVPHSFRSASSLEDRFLHLTGGAQEQQASSR